MTIHHFAEDQNVVFVPALFALLAATVLVCLPIVFAQGLQRSGRRTPVTAIAWVLAAAAIGVAGWQAAAGFGTLGAERAQVRSAIASDYGVRLPAAQVDELIDGGEPMVTLPEQAAAAGLRTPDEPHRLSLEPTGDAPDTYDLAIGGKPIPR